MSTGTIEETALRWNCELVETKYREWLAANPSSREHNFLALVDCSTTTLKRLRSDPTANPTVKLLYRLSRALGVYPDDLVILEAND